jgi:hypothetical protein
MHNNVCASLTGLDVQLERPNNAFPSKAFNRSLLFDVAIPPKLNAAVLVRCDQRKHSVLHFRCAAAGGVKKMHGHK